MRIELLRAFVQKIVRSAPKLSQHSIVVKRASLRVDAECHKRRRTSLFDHLVSAGEQGRGNGEAEDLRGPSRLTAICILGRKFDGQVGSAVPLTNFLRDRRGLAASTISDRHNS